MKIIFDLDGTLIDSRERLYRLFQELVPESKLSFDDYWQLKRNKIGHEQILGEKFFYSPEKIEAFKKTWMDQIELPQWLKLDKPFEGVTEYLKQLKNKYDLYLITSRQFEDKALQQASELGWDGIFTKIFVTGQKQNKIDLIKGSIQTGNEDWFIGDTGHDILNGKTLNMRTAAVLSGFLNEKILLEYKPDLIIDNVVNFNP